MLKNSILTKSTHSLILASGLVLTLILLIARAIASNIPSHDESISYLAATGHQGRYELQVPSEQWVTAKTWQAYWKPETFGSFRTIGRDLALYDVHPPLYFWILHIWVHIFGVDLTIGQILNMIPHLLTGLVIYKTCQLLEFSKISSSVAGVAWTLSGSTLDIASEARQYTLLGFVSTCFVASTILYLKKHSLSNLVLLYVSALAGLLTHYYFMIELGVVSVLAALLQMKYRNWRSIVVMILSLVTSFLTFIIVHPLFLNSFDRNRLQTQVFSPEEMPFRIARSIFSIIELIAPSDIIVSIGEEMIKYWQLPVVVIGVSGLTVLLLKRGKWKYWLGKIRFDVQWLPLWISTTTILILWMFYIFQFSPRHAMRGKYLVTATPILFMLLAQLIDNLKGLKVRWYPLLVVLLLGYQATHGIYTTTSYIQQKQNETIPVALKQKPPIILDTTARGILPRILWSIDPSTPVYAASQDALLNHFPGDIFDTDRILYVSVLEYDNTSKKQGAILKRFEAGGLSIDDSGKNIFGVGEVFELEK